MFQNKTLVQQPAGPPPPPSPARRRLAPDLAYLPCPRRLPPAASQRRANLSTTVMPPLRPSFRFPAAGNRRIPCHAANSDSRANPASTSPKPNRGRRRNSAPTTAAGPPSNSAGDRSITTPISATSSRTKNQVRDGSQPPPSPSQSSLHPGEALVYWFLHNHNAITSADASRLPELKDCFQIRHGILVTNKNCRLEMPDPWGIRPIQSFVELVYTDRQLVLLRLSSTDISFSAYFFIYGFPFSEGEDATIVKLPQIASELWASQSFGLVRHRFNSEKYVVVNLERRYNPVIKRVQAFLHRWWYSGASWQSKLNAEVTQLSGTDIFRKWQTDKVITFMDTLLWVDLSQGVILRCNNPLHYSEANFDFIYLPKMKRVRRPQTFVCVGCFHNELKLVNILDTSNVNTVNVSVMTFNKSSYKTQAGAYSSYNKRQAGAYWNLTSLISLELWSAMKDMPTLQHLPSDLKALENYMVCFPVLSSCKDSILYLTLAKRDNTRAWLLEVDTKLSMLVGAADFSGFSKHRQPPYSSNFEVNTESYPGFS